MNSILEIRHLRTMLALKNTGSIARAADLLNLTQSTLSHQIKALEDYYEQTIFERKSSPIVFTATGLALLALATQVLPLFEKTERDLAKLIQGEAGTLRVALECHTCFDWLMPVMNDYRKRWPDVEIDLVSGFHQDPLELLKSNDADVMICSNGVTSAELAQDFASFPLFRFEIMAVLPHKHALQAKKRLEAIDFSGETLITYPVPENRIDLIRERLAPAGIVYTRRTAELTVAILQLVASRRGISALPNWGIKNYVDYDYVLAKPIGEQGLWSDLYVTVPVSLKDKPYLRDFIQVVREQCAGTLDGIKLLNDPLHSASNE